MVRNGHIEEERVFSEPIETGWLRKQILGGGRRKDKNQIRSVSQRKTDAYLCNKRACLCGKLETEK